MKAAPMYGAAGAKSYTYLYYLGANWLPRQVDPLWLPNSWSHCTRECLEHLPVAQRDIQFLDPLSGFRLLHMEICHAWHPRLVWSLLLAPAVRLHWDMHIPTSKLPGARLQLDGRQNTPPCLLPGLHGNQHLQLHLVCRIPGLQLPRSRLGFTRSLFLCIHVRDLSGDVLHRLLHVEAPGSSRHCPASAT